MAAAALLPDTEEDFRSQRFWDGFFRARGAAAFEWYGEWRQLRPIVEPLCRGRRILIPGCGNSELSAQLCGLYLTTLLSATRTQPRLNMQPRRPDEPLAGDQHVGM